MAKHTMPERTIGIDLGDRYSAFCVLDADGEVIERGKVSTTRPELEKWAAIRSGCRVVIEVGTHSPWVSRLLAAHKCETFVANPRRLKLIYQDARKNDHRDAEYLARVGRLDPHLLQPIEHRGEEVQRHRVLLRSRDALVQARTALINHIRGSVKSFGGRVPSSVSTDAFGHKAQSYVPVDLQMVLRSILEQIEALTSQIRAYDKQIEQLVRENYRGTLGVSQIKGVGPLTSLAFVLTIEDPNRFSKSREVGAYFGLVPKRQDSGEQSPQLRITKNGDEYVRKLLVSAAHYILGPFGEDCDLRRHGQAIAARGGKNGKKRAIIAVARKLAVLMHRLWVTGEQYEPLRNSQPATDAMEPRSAAPAAV